MKKIHKTHINSTKIQSKQTNFDVDFMQLLPKILKIIPNLDLSKLTNFLSQNRTTNTNQTKQQRSNFSKQAASDFMENHTKITQKLKK